MKNSRLCTLVIIFFSGFTLLACEAPPKVVAYPDLRFNHLPTINLDVARIEIVEQYRSPLRRPFVEHELPLTPAKVMRRWARDRLRAVGTSGYAIFTIMDGSVRAQEIPKKKTLNAIFTLGQVALYVAKMEAKLEIEIAGGMGKGFAQAKASRQRTMPEVASINDRDDALYSFIEATAKDFDQVISVKIDAHLIPFRVKN